MEKAKYRQPRYAPPLRVRPFSRMLFAYTPQTSVVLRAIYAYYTPEQPARLSASAAFAPPCASQAAPLLPLDMMRAHDAMKRCRPLKVRRGAGERARRKGKALQSESAYANTLRGVRVACFVAATATVVRSTMLWEL